MIVRHRPVAIALVASLCPGVLAQQFSFAGLGRQTTVEEIRKRYPHSAVFGQHIDVAEVDSHDHIHGMDVASADGPSRQLRLYFERRVRGRNVYPACDAVGAVIRKQYGEPVGNPPIPQPYAPAGIELPPTISAQTGSPVPHPNYRPVASNEEFCERSRRRCLRKQIEGFRSLDWSRIGVCLVFGVQPTSSSWQGCQLRSGSPKSKVSHHLSCVQSH